MNTTAQEVYDSFDSSFRDRNVIPEGLKLEWLKRAVGRYCVEVADITFNATNGTFGAELTRYAIDTLACFMKQSYQEREVSKANKRVSIVGKDLSIDGNNGTKAAVRQELEYIADKSEEMISNVLPTAYV